MEAETEQDALNAAEAPMDKDIALKTSETSITARTADVLGLSGFTVPAGKSFSILSGTGSGKTACCFCSAVCTRHGDKITVGGVDIADMPARYVRENVGVVLQSRSSSPARCRRTSASAARGSDAEIRAAAVTAAWTGISPVSQGYDTMVGERGVSLSGGQKQRGHRPC